MNSPPLFRLPRWISGLLFLSILNGLAVPVSARQFALLVGVRAYPRASDSLTPLPFAERDAQDLAPILEKLGYQVTLMTHANAEGEGNERFLPNAALIRKELALLVDRPNLKESDTILVVLAGHGIQLKSETDKTKAVFYFCPADADVAGLSHLEKVAETHHLIPIQELYDSINKCAAGLKLLVVDACRNDPNQGGFRDVNSVTRPPLPTPPGGMLAIFSCSAGEKAREDQKLGHGVFGHFFIKGLSGEADLNKDGELKLMELHEYTTDHTYDYVSRVWSAKQTPELTGAIRGSITIASIPRKPEPEPLPPVKPIPTPTPTPVKPMPRPTPVKPMPMPTPVAPPAAKTPSDWKTVRNFTEAEFVRKTDEYTKANFRVHDLEVYDQGGQTRFAAIYHKNDDDRGWWGRWRQNKEQFDRAFVEYRTQYRMTDIEVISETSAGSEEMRYSGVWVENKENLNWACRWNLSATQWLAEFAKYKKEGYRPVDIEVYTHKGEVYFAAVWVENPAQLRWEMHWGLTHEQYEDKFNAMIQADYRPVDMESNIASNNFYYAGIWEENVSNDDWSARWNLTTEEYSKYSAEFIQAGKAPIDFYSYSVGGKIYYGGVWSSNPGSLEPPKPRPNAKPQPKPRPVTPRKTKVPSGFGSGD